MTELHLRIDRIVVELADASRAPEVDPALRRSFELLAHKLLDAGLVPAAVDLGSTFAELGEDVVTAEVLLSPDGPERLAAALFQTIERRLLARARNEGATA